MQVEAAIATGFGSFQIDFIEVGEPQGDDVLVELKAAGICYTDYNSLSWGKPIIMGHELYDLLHSNVDSPN